MTSVVPHSTCEVPSRVTWLRLLAWLILFVSLGLSLLGWQMLHRVEHERTQNRFQTIVDRMTRSINERLKQYELVIIGSKGLYAASTSVTRPEWKAYVAELEIDEELTGLLGMGYIAKVPAEKAEEYEKMVRLQGYPQFKIRPEQAATEDRFVITFLEPLARNAAAIGLDVASEPRRRAAAERARDTGEASITGKIFLAQETENQPGFLLMVPVFEPGSKPETVEERRAAIKGWVYAPFRAPDLMRGIFDAKNPELAFRVYDGDPDHANLLYESGFSERRKSFEGVSAAITTPVFGRTWTLEYHTLPAFDAAAGGLEPALLLISGILASFLLFGIVWSMEHTQRRATKLARQMTETLRMQAGAINAAHDSIIVTDPNLPDNPIIFVNPAFENMTGYSPAEALGKNCRFLHGNNHDQPELNRLRQALRNQEACRVVIQNFKKDGTRFWNSLSVSPAFDDYGKLRHFVGVATDITERLELVEALGAARDKALESTRLKSEFLANMSHEIRTPLNGIIGMLGLLLDSGLNPVQRKFADTINQSAETLLSLLSDILDFSKIEAGKLKFEQVDFNLQEVVENTVDLLASRAQAKSLELAALIGPDVPPLLLGDPGRIGQILLNLLGNAIKFTEKGEVIVRVELLSQTESKAQIRCSVTDTGIGIEPQAIEKLFSPFTQADGSMTRRFGGTGLGLAISKQLVELMGGQIGVESKRGHGSVFWFVLPLQTRTPGAGAESRHKPLNNRKVLIVDDNPINCEIVRRQTLAWGMKNDGAENAASARLLVEKAFETGAPYDLILLDMLMPGEDGLSLARSISRDPRLRGPKLVMLTSLGPGISEAALEEAGIIACLAKPIRQSRLYDCLVQIFASESSTPAPAEEAAPPLPNRKLRILIVEDNQINQMVAVGQLERLGFKAEVASNGLEVLEALQRSAFDLIFMDCQMPVMDGYEATRQIRALSLPKQPRIIAMTAHAMTGDREKCLEAGMDDYLSKPVRQQDLRKALQWFSGPQATEAPSGHPLFDPAVLARQKELLGPDGQSLWPELAQAFLEEGTQIIRNLRELASQPQKLRKVLARFQSACLEMGANQLAQSCAFAENALAEPNADLLCALERVEKSWAEAEQELRRMLAGT